MEGEEILQLFKLNNCNIENIVIEKDLSIAYDQIIKKDFDFVFLALTEDIPIQDLLDMMHIPYNGSSRLATTISMDKVLTKELVQSINVLTPKYFYTRDKFDVKLFMKNIKEMKFPIIIKPGNLGTSIGLSFINSSEQLISGIERCLRYSNYILAEEFIDGVEVTIPMMGDNFFGIVEIHSEKKLYDNESKMGDLREQICPSKLPKKIQDDILEQSKQIYKLLNCDGLVRIDGIVSENKFYFLEINTLPFMVGEDAPVQVAKKLYNMNKLDFLIFIIIHRLNKDESSL
ncbi:MAG: ATP-grasp domain-containing protein [bacterium]|nr:ATP-grasp domain-containing protein [bacterium]